MAVSPVTSNQQTNSSGSSNPLNAAGSMDTTFLNLLTTELQAQDPTAPMDGNQMVSQMVALNSLDQLIAIRETLQQATSTTQTQNSVANGGN